MAQIVPKKSDTKEILIFYVKTLNERLEKETKRRYDSNSKLKKQTEKADELEYLVEVLHKKVDKLYNQLEEIKQVKELEIQKLNYELEELRKSNGIKKNERNAGRKSLVTKELISKIKEMSDNGINQKLISENVGVSVGTVNKILKNEKDKAPRR